MLKHFHRCPTIAHPRSIFLVLGIFALAALSGCGQDNSQPTHTETKLEPTVSNPAATIKQTIADLDLSSSIRPQDNFWGYVNQNWIDATEIPADKSSHGTFYILRDTTEEQIKDIIEKTQAELTAGSGTADALKIGNLYSSFLDTDQIEKKGLAPLTKIITQIDEVNNHGQLAELFGHLVSLNINTPVDFYADNDATDQTQLILYLWQSGLGLPNRDYYLSDQEKLVTAKADYHQHIQNMFGLADWVSDPEQQKAIADDILALESKIANAHWTQVQSRDRETIYSNQYAPDEAQALAVKFNLASWFKGLGREMPDKFVMAQTSYFESIGAIVANTSVETWKNYLRFHTLKSFAAFLPSAIDNENFDFQGKKLRGQQAQAERWKRGVRLVNGSTGELLGKLYVAKHFPEQSKAEISNLVENLRDAYGTAIKELDWMSESTKGQALEKLASFLPKLGYTDNWRDFSALKLTSNQLIENVITVRKFNHEFGLSKLDKPVDRGEWTANPQTVNAFYRPTHNSITFPAGILQSPMFSTDADPAMNYGAIGSIIGHEFSHGFDDQGRKFDGQGLLRNWWTEADAEQYKTRSAGLVEQFNAYNPLPDTPVNGQLTLGENIGDLAGVIMAFRAFELSGYADGPTIAGLTPKQRFFIGYAVAFRAKFRDPYLRELLLRDSHSPSEFRVIGTLVNVPAFKAAYEVKEGDGMYVADQDIIKIW